MRLACSKERGGAWASDVEHKWPGRGQTVQACFYVSYARTVRRVCARAHGTHKMMPAQSEGCVRAHGRL